MGKKYITATFEVDFEEFKKLLLKNYKELKGEEIQGMYINTSFDLKRQKKVIINLKKEIK